MEASLLDLIYGAVADPDLWPDVLVGVSDHLGALGGMLAHVPRSGSKQPATQILGRLRQLSVILEMMPNAALLLDGRGRIVQANKAADELLRRADGIAFDAGGGLRLACALIGERQALSRALKDALRVAGGLGGALCEPVRISRTSDAAPLLVVAVPLPRPSFRFWELVSPARVLVLIVDPTAKSRATATTMQAAYGLTAAESRVAPLLAGGVAGVQMPAMLGVTSGTIKTHLRRCFEKTGTHSQAELSRLLATIPPIDGRDDQSS